MCWCVIGWRDPLVCYCLRRRPGAPNHVPRRAESMQVFIPTNHYTRWFNQLVPSSLVEGVLIS